MVGIPGLIRQAMERASKQISEIIEKEIAKLMREDDDASPAKRRGRPPKEPAAKNSFRRARLPDAEKRDNEAKVIAALKNEEALKRAGLLAATGLDEYRLNQAIGALLKTKRIRKEGLLNATKYFLVSDSGGSPKKNAATKKTATKKNSKKATKGAAATAKGVKGPAAMRVKAPAAQPEVIAHVADTHGDGEAAQ